MQKPNGYDDTQAFTGEFETLKPGGYICKIIQAKEDTTSTGKPVLIIIFDIAEGEYKEIFKRRFDAAKKRNADAKWKGIFRQLTEGNSTKFFKGMLTSIEESNPGYKFNFDENTLKGKLFGGIFGREQYQKNNGDYAWDTKCQSVRSIATIRKGAFEIPADKYAVKPSADSVYKTPTSASDFTDLQDDDGDLPF
jgi:hypothetical protein